MTENSLETFVDLKEVVEAVGDAVIVADLNGQIRLWNPSAERLFGFTPAEALGSSLDLIIPERLRARHWASYKKTMATGTTRYAHDVLKVRSVRKDGQSLSIAFTVGLMYDPEHTVTEIVAVIRDDTRRFSEERDLPQATHRVRKEKQRVRPQARRSRKR